MHRWSHLLSPPTAVFSAAASAPACVPCEWLAARCDGPSPQGAARWNHPENCWWLSAGLPESRLDKPHCGIAVVWKRKKNSRYVSFKKNAGWSGNPLEHLKTFKSTPIQSGNSGPEKASINWSELCAEIYLLTWCQGAIFLSTVWQIFIVWLGAKVSWICVRHLK